MNPSHPSKFRVTLSIQLTSEVLLEHLFPDGDAPANPTIDDVLKIVKDNDGPSRMIKEWDLIDPDLCMDVTLIEDDDFRATTTVDYYGRELKNSRLVMVRR